MNIKKITTCALIASMTALMFSGCKKEEPVETVPTTEATVATTTETTAATTETSFVTYSAEEYRNAGVNELNSVPILMYHRVYGMKNSETEYTGGNVDKDGYNIDKIIDGETIADVLDYVQYDARKLVRTLERWVTSAVKDGRISLEEGKEFLSNYRSGLYGYTYLDY